MLTKLAASDLNAKDARQLGFKPLVVPPPEITYKAAGFVIPYYKITGERNGFYRYRYLESIMVKGKPLRYSQPAGKPPRPYFTPLIDWPRYLKENVGENRVLVITEGELKAACATKNGLPCIGLGGVWNFKSRTTGLSEELVQINWAEAVVYIVYDSDAVSNYQVVAAENALAKELLALQARIHIVRLPQLQEDHKTGLDDFLVAKGRKEFDTLLAETDPWEVSRQLHELNEEVVFVHDPGSVLEIITGQRMATRIFSQSVYANRIWEEVTFGTKGKPRTVKKNAAAEWVKWPGRAEVRRTTYAPGLPRITETREFNTWLGWGCEPVKGDIKLWHQFMEYFFTASEAEDKAWFERWLAYPLQHPGTKMFTAVVVHGGQGFGKTLAAYTMRRIYGVNFSEIGEDQLLGSFNEWAENKQFVTGDEIAGGDKRAFADRLKAVITRESIRINAKYIPTYTVPDRINYYFTSNHPDSFYLEDEDRRFFIHELRAGPLPLDFAKEYDAWYNSSAGAGALFYYFLHLNLEGFNPKAPAKQTRAKREMTELGRSDVGAWVAALKEDPQQILRLGTAPPLRHRFMTTEELFRIWDPEGRGKLTKPGLSRALRSGGFRPVNRGEPVWTATGAVRLWAVQGDLKAAETMTTKEIARMRNEDLK